MVGWVEKAGVKYQLRPFETLACQ